MSIAEIKATAEQKMHRSVEAFQAELVKIRTGRAHPGILDQVHVDYYGSMLPIGQVANVTLLDARTISVQPWGSPGGSRTHFRGDSAGDWRWPTTRRTLESRELRDGQL